MVKGTSGVFRFLGQGCSGGNACTPEEEKRVASEVVCPRVWATRASRVLEAFTLQVLLCSIPVSILTGRSVAVARVLGSLWPPISLRQDLYDNTSSGFHPSLGEVLEGDFNEADKASTQSLFCSASFFTPLQASLS